MTAEPPQFKGSSAQQRSFIPGPLLSQLFSKRATVRYALALLITLAALVLRRLFDPILGDLGPFLSVYAAVILTSVYLGAGPAVITTFVGLLGSTRWFLSRDHFSFESRSDLTYVIGFLLVAGTIIVLAERARQALLQFEAARASLEHKVEERTRELQDALSKLQAEMSIRAESEEAGRKLSARLLHIQDEEHRRIARELHDSMGQTLAALKMTADSLSNMVRGNAAASTRLEEVETLIDQAIRETRTVSHLLHPPMLDELGFASAARWYVTGFAQRSGIKVNLEMPEGQRFPQSTELTLFRVLQESLTNILRHPGSKTAEVRLEIAARELIFSVKDYGKGIASDRLERFLKTGTDVGVGLGGMRERVSDLGGRLELQNHGAGTTVSVILPFTTSMAKSAEANFKNSGLVAGA